MNKPIILALQAKNTTLTETNFLPNYCPNSFVQKQSCCPSTTELVKPINNMEDANNNILFQSDSCPNLFVQEQFSCTKTMESISFKEAKEHKRRKIKRALEILIKKGGESKKPPSWMVLRGKERRKNIKRIMQTFKCGKIINPFSDEQFRSFKNALQEHGQDDEMPTTSGENNGDFLDDEEVVLDFGGIYGNSESDECLFNINRVYFVGNYGNSEFGECHFNINGGYLGGNYGNSEFDDSSYVSNESMEMSSVEEMLNGFLEEKLL